MRRVEDYKEYTIETLPGCQHPTGDSNGEDTDCGFDVYARVVWKEDNSVWYVCENHYYDLTNEEETCQAQS